MRGIARLVSLALVAGALAVVPAGLASAVTGDLEVTPELGKAQIKTGAEIELTATVKADPPGAAAVPGAMISYIIEAGFGQSPTPVDACGTAGTGADGTCKFKVPGPATGSNQTSTLRVWVEDDSIPGPIPEADMTEGRDEAMTAGVTPEGDNTDVILISWENPVAAQLDVTPETQATDKESGTEVTLSALVKDQFGNNFQPANVDMEIQTGPNANQKTGVDGECDVNATTNPCLLKYTGKKPVGTTNLTDTVRLWLDLDGDDVPNDATEIDSTEGRDEAVTPGAKPEVDGYDVVEVKWKDAAPAQGTDLDVSPETQTVPLESGRAAAASATLTASVKVNGTATAGKKVLFEVTSGPNFGVTFECTTVADGTCTGTLPESPDAGAEGTDTVLAVADTDGNGQANEADTTEGRDEATTPGANAEVDETDLIEVTWEAPPAPPCTGTNEDDLLIGSGDDDTCLGKGGNDTIKTKGGNDDVKGGGGADVLLLGSGNDTANGGGGDDTLKGGSGNDKLTGGGGNNDTTKGGPGNDTCNAENEGGC